MAQESSQATRKADAKEELVFLTSGAKEKLSKTLVGASETAYKLLHPFNKEAREQATEKAKDLKRQVSNKQAAVREAAHQQAEAERQAILVDGDVPSSAPLCPNPASDFEAHRTAGSESPLTPALRRSLPLNRRNCSP